MRETATVLSGPAYRAQALACWADFHAACLHFWQLERAPLGLVAQPHGALVVRQVCVCVFVWAGGLRGVC